MKLLHGDCLELMKDIPANSIDMVLTDPPYGTTACKWDNVIPFEPMWNELKRITKDNGAICLFGSEPFSSHLRLSNLKMFKYDWVWQKEKNQGADFIQAKNKPICDIEMISVFSGGKTFHEGMTKNRMAYFPQGLERVDAQRKGQIKVKELRTVTSRATVKKQYTQEFTNYPRVIISKFKNRAKEKRLHPTQKPVALLEYLIKTYTLENKTVLDFTMGSGSTGVACKNLNRQFIGIEKDDNYFQIAKNRIENHELRLI